MVNYGSVIQVQNGAFHILPFTSINVDWKSVSKDFQYKYMVAYQEAKTLLETKGQEKEGLYYFYILDVIGNLIKEQKVSNTEDFTLLYHSLSNDTYNELNVA